MAWTAANLTPGVGSKSHQTINTAVGSLEASAGVGHFPCVSVGDIDFSPPYLANGSTCDTFLRYVDSTHFIRARLRGNTGGRYDFSVIQNDGVDLSVDPEKPTIPWAQANGLVHAALPDGSGGWYIGGDFLTLTDADGSTENLPYLAHINANGTVDTAFDAHPNGAVYCLALNADDSTLYAGGIFTSVDTGAAHGGPFTRRRLAAFHLTTGAPKAGFADPGITNGQVNSIDYKNLTPHTIFVGGTFNYGAGKYAMKFNAVTGVQIAWAPSLINDGVAVIKYVGSGVLAGVVMATRYDADTQVSLVKFAATGAVPNVYSGSRIKLGHPVFDAQAYAIHYETATDLVYVGGRFASFNGQFTSGARKNLLVYKDDGALVQSWAPPVYQTDDADASYVSSLQLNAPAHSIYIGGSFAVAGLDSKPRNNIAELNIDTANAVAWNPGTGSIVQALAFDSANKIVLAGGDFVVAGGLSRQSLAAFNVLSGATVTTIFETTNQRMPSDKRFALNMALDCGDLLKVVLREYATSGVLHYIEKQVQALNSRKGRIEIGPANMQGPQIDDVTMNSKACNEAIPDTFVACGDKFVDFVSTGDNGTDEAYPEIYVASYTLPREWAGACVGTSPPLQRPARWWHESFTRNADAFLTGVGLGGGVGFEAVQFTNAFCIDVADLRDYSPAPTTDPSHIMQRWFNLMLFGTKTTVGDKTTFTGLSFRIDFKNSTVAFGRATDMGVIRNSHRRSHRGSQPTKADIVLPGQFDVITQNTVSNLDRWSLNGLSMTLEYACNNDLTLSLYGSSPSAVDELILTMTVNLDLTTYPTVANFTGAKFVLSAFIEAANLTALDDDDDCQIGLDALYAAVAASCEAGGEA